jgi:hypothetical protein
VKLDDLIPVRVGGGLVVWHTPTELARLRRGTSAALSAAHSSVPLEEPTCTCHAECICDDA